MRPMSDATRDSATPGAEWSAGEPPIAWQIRDVGGRLHATLLRFADKSFAWRGPAGQSGLDGVGVENLPVYLAETLSRIPNDTMVLVVEGCKAAEALRRSAIAVVASITGAAGTPNRQVLKVLAGRPVCLWPDNDDIGRDHMRRIGELLLDIAAEVWWIEPGDRLPVGGDAADVPPGRLGEFLDSAVPFLVATRGRVGSNEDERKSDRR